jgi:hypothetical protein
LFYWTIQGEFGKILHELWSALPGLLLLLYKQFRDSTNY